MDEVDIANDRVLADLEMRLAEKRAKMRQLGPPDCEECGAAVIAARRQLGLGLCIDCARSRERRAKLFSRD